MAISDQLRQTIRDSALSLNRIARETGIAQPILSRFMSGDPEKNDIRLQRTADKLAEFFGLILTAKPGAASSPSDKKKSSAVAKSSSARKSSSAASTPARRTKPRSKPSSRSRSPGRSRGTTRRLTPEEMDKEIARVEWENGTGKGRLRIAKPGGE